MLPDTEFNKIFYKYLASISEILLHLNLVYFETIFYPLILRENIQSFT